MLGACDTGEPRQAGPGRRSGADLSASGRGGASRSPPRHFGEERPSKSFGIYFDSRTYWFEASSGWPLVLMAGPLRWAVDSAGGTKPAKPSGPGFLRGASPGRRAFPLLVWSERRRAGQRLRVDDCYGWPIGASHDRTAPRVGKRGAACFGGRSRSGYPSLLLRPLFPNRLVTGVVDEEYSVMLV